MSRIIQKMNFNCVEHIWGKLEVNFLIILYTIPIVENDNLQHVGSSVFRNELAAHLHFARIYKRHASVAVAADRQHSRRNSVHGRLGVRSVGHHRLLLV